MVVEQRHTGGVRQEHHAGQLRHAIAVREAGETKLVGEPLDPSPRETRARHDAGAEMDVGSVRCGVGVVQQGLEHGGYAVDDGAPLLGESLEAGAREEDVGRYHGFAAVHDRCYDPAY